MNRKQVDVLREEAFQLMRDRALSPPLLGLLTRTGASKGSQRGWT